MKTVLVVENMDSLRELLVDELTESGYKVIAAQDTNAARTLLAGTVPDLALLDIKLPGESGVDLAKELKKTHPQVPVIFCTAYWDEKTMAEMSSTEVVDLLIKPFDLGELKKRVKEIVG